MKFPVIKAVKPDAVLFYNYEQLVIKNVD